MNLVHANPPGRPEFTMSHETYSIMALFDTAATAAVAVAAAREAGFTDDQISIVMHQDAVAGDENLKLTKHSAGESLAAHDAFEGLLMGGAGGALALALIAGPAGWIGAGWLAVVAFGVGTAGAFGALGGAIIGLGFPRVTVDDVEAALAAHKVLVTARIDTAEHRAQVERIFIDCGASLVHRAGS